MVDQCVQRHAGRIAILIWLSYTGAGMAEAQFSDFEFLFMSPGIKRAFAAREIVCNAGLQRLASMTDHPDADLALAAQWRHLEVATLGKVFDAGRKAEFSPTKRTVDQYVIQLQGRLGTPPPQPWVNYIRTLRASGKGGLEILRGTGGLEESPSPRNYRKWLRYKGHGVDRLARWQIANVDSRPKPKGVALKIAEPIVADSTVLVSAGTARLMFRISKNFGHSPIFLIARPDATLIGVYDRQMGQLIIEKCRLTGGNVKTMWRRVIPIPYGITGGGVEPVRMSAIRHKDRVSIYIACFRSVGIVVLSDEKGVVKHLFWSGRPSE